MALAATNIKHGNEDGSVVWVDAGDEIPGDIPVDDLPVGTVQSEEENADRAQLAELQTQVAELEAKLSAAETANRPVYNAPVSEGAPAETNEFGDEGGAGSSESETPAAE
jgi:hypothetical protein